MHCRLVGSPPGVLFVTGDAPSINIQAGRLSMSGAAGIVSARFGPGNPPAVVITADTIEIRNGASIAMSNLFGGGTFPTSGGTLTINGNNMTLSSDGRTDRSYRDSHNGQLPSGIWYIANPVLSVLSVPR